MSSSADRRAARCHSIADLRNQAQRVLPKMMFDFLDGAAQTEESARENEAAIRRHRLISRAPADVSNRDASVNLFGKRARMPLVIGPTGYAAGFWPDGDAILARAAGKFGIPFVVSNGANATLEHIRKSAPDARLWLQIYIPPDLDRSRRLIARAQSLGFDGLEITVDTAIPGRRVRDIVNGLSIPFRWTPGKIIGMATRPGWAMRMLAQGQPLPGLMEGDAGGRSDETISDFMRSQINPSLCWDDLRRIRDEWKGALIVKGVLDPAQVELAVAAGYDGLVISNHGGRQLDSSVATIDMLPEFVAAAAGRLSILIDGGFRSGTDVFKAVALGASAVQVGRATLFGLAAAGAAGVERTLQLFELELDLTMGLTGTKILADADPNIVRSA